MLGSKKVEIKEQLSNARKDLLQWARKLDEGDWTEPVYVHDEEWTAQDVLRHLTWAEGGMIRLIQQIREGQEGVPPDFDLDRYNAGGVRKLMDKMPADLMAMMADNRERLLQILDDLSEEEIGLTGRHGSLRIMSIEEVLHRIADHEIEHLADLKQVAGGM